MKPFPWLLLLVLFATAASAAQENWWTRNNAVRGVPEPALDAGVFPKHSFRLDDQKGEAVEQAELGQGIMLTIVHSGWEYYNLAYCFELPSDTHAPANPAYWYRKAAELLALIMKANKAAVDLAGGRAELARYAEKGKNIVYEEALPLENGEGAESAIGQIVTLKPVLKKDGRTTVTIFFAIGPL